MPNKKTPFVVQTRQKVGILWLKTFTVAAGATVDVGVLPIRQVDGYDQINFLVTSEKSFSLLTLEASDPGASFIRTSSNNSAIDPVTGLQKIAVFVAPSGRYMRVLFTNTSADDAEFNFCGYGLPVGGAGSSGSSSGIDVVVVGIEPGTTIYSPSDTVVGVGAIVPLTSPPAGTRRMRVIVTGGDSTTVIRVREVGGIVGAGAFLNLYGSTLYGGSEGSIAEIEVENVSGPTASVAIQFEVN